MTRKIGLRCLVLASMLGLLGFSATAVAQQPVTLRIARGPAAEEQLWLLKARPDLAPNYGKKYTVDMTFIPFPEQRFQAMEAGSIDMTASNTPVVLSAAASGQKIKIVAGICRESTKGVQIRFFVREDSPIKSAADFKGTTVAQSGLRTTGHLLTLLAGKKAGVDLEQSTKFVSILFPLQGAALRSNQVDVIALVEPFTSMELKKGGIRQLFSSRDIVPFDEELLVLVASQNILDKQPEAVRAFLSDLQTVTTYYLNNRKEARQALLKAEVFKAPPDIYLDMPDWYREPNLQVDAESIKKTQELFMSAGFQEKKADVDKLVDLSFLPK